MRMACVSFVVVFALAAPLRAQGAAGAGVQVTRAQAQRLVASALTAAGRRTPGKRFDAMDPARLNGARAPGRFYAFEVTGDTPGHASAVLGHFAVNRTTGDVWDAVACYRLTSREIRRFQQRLRRRTGLSAAAFRRAAAVRPCEP